MNSAKWLAVLPALLILCAGCQSGPPGQQGPYQTLAADPSRDSEAARLRNRQGAALLKHGDVEGAEAKFQAALAADPFCGPAHNGLGVVYLQQDKCYLAAWEFQYAAKLMPHKPEPRNNLGLVMERVGKLEEAAASYRGALDSEPDDPQFIGNLARCYVRLGRRTPETVELLRQLILKDTRPEWTEWARSELSRMPNGSLLTPSSPEMGPTSQPAGRLETTASQPGSKGPDPDGISPE